MGRGSKPRNMEEEFKVNSWDSPAGHRRPYPPGPTSGGEHRKAIGEQHLETNNVASTEQHDVLLNQEERATSENALSGSGELTGDPRPVLAGADRNTRLNDGISSSQPGSECAILVSVKGGGSGQGPEHLEVAAATKASAAAKGRAPQPATTSSGRESALATAPSARNPASISHVTSQQVATGAAAASIDGRSHAQPHTTSCIMPAPTPAAAAATSTDRLQCPAFSEQGYSSGYCDGNDTTASAAVADQRYTMNPGYTGKEIRDRCKKLCLVVSPTLARVLQMDMDQGEGKGPTIFAITCPI